MATKVEAWHFLQEDKRLRYGRKTVVKVGQTVRVKGTPILCEHGLHASKRAIDALGYAPGPIISRVLVGGIIVEGSDKLAGTSRTVLWMADATNTLHEFACWCAEQALRTAKVEDRRAWNAIETKRKWLKGEATDEELAAARDAAGDAAGAAAWAAARDAAGDAAGAAAWDAAGDAAGAAAWDAAWAAARAAAWDAAGDAAGAAAGAAAWVAARVAQNERLEEMLRSLEPVAKEVA